MKNYFKIYAVTLVCIVIGYYLVILLHEYSHGLTAWLLGFKDSPFDIYYGIAGKEGWLLENVDENVNYDQLFSHGFYWQGALIGISGITCNVIQGLFFWALLQIKSVQKSVWKFSFCFWALVINLWCFACYVYYSSFSTMGDIGRFDSGLGISPWWVYLIGTLMTFIWMASVFKKDILAAYRYILPPSLLADRIYLYFTLIMLFYFGPIRSILIYSFFNHAYHLTLLTRTLLALSVIAFLLGILFDSKKVLNKCPSQHDRLLATTGT